MLVDGFVLVSWDNSTNKYYLSLGYPKLPRGSKFKIPIAHLPATSSLLVQVRCYTCGVVNKIRYRDFTKRNGKAYICTSCSRNLRITSLEDAKEAFYNLGLEPLFDHYTPGKKLAYRCQKHPELLQYKNLTLVTSGYGCKYCGYENMVNITKHSLTKIKELFLSVGYTPLFDEYKNSRTLLEFSCPRHGIQKINYDSLSRGIRCSKCSTESTATKLRTDIEVVRAKFVERNMTPTFTEYINASTRLTYVCNRHLINGTQTITYNSLCQNHGCYYCGLEKSDYHLYGGDKQAKNIGTFLRLGVQGWKKLSLNLYSGQCALTKVTKNLNVHHIISHSTVVAWAHKALGIPLRILVTDYNPTELALLGVLTKYYHERCIPAGIPLHREIHKFYHELYGYENTLEQWMEFENNYFKVKGLKHDAYSFN